MSTVRAKRAYRAACWVVVALQACATQAATSSQPAAPVASEGGGSAPPSAEPSEPAAPEATPEDVAPTRTVRPGMSRAELERAKRDNCQRAIAAASARGTVQLDVLLRVDERYRDDVDPESRIAFEDRADAMSRELVGRLDRELPAAAVRDRKRVTEHGASWELTANAEGARWLCAYDEIIWLNEAQQLQLH
jgi:hypothetical protein